MQAPNTFTDLLNQVSSGTNPTWSFALNKVLSNLNGYNDQNNLSMPNNFQYQAPSYQEAFSKVLSSLVGGVTSYDIGGRRADYTYGANNPAYNTGTATDLQQKIPGLDLSKYADPNDRFIALNDTYGRTGPIPTGFINPYSPSALQYLNSQWQGANQEYNQNAAAQGQEGVAVGDLNAMAAKRDALARVLNGDSSQAAVAALQGYGYQPTPGWGQQTSPLVNNPASNVWQLDANVYDPTQKIKDFYGSNQFKSIFGNYAGTNPNSTLKDIFSNSGFAGAGEQGINNLMRQASMNGTSSSGALQRSIDSFSNDFNKKNMDNFNSSLQGVYNSWLTNNQDVGSFSPSNYTNNAVNSTYTPQQAAGFLTGAGSNIVSMLGSALSGGGGNAQTNQFQNETSLVGGLNQQAGLQSGAGKATGGNSMKGGPQQGNSMGSNGSSF